MTPQEPTDPYAAEAEQRWGHTPAWAQSKARMSTYGKQEWQAFNTAFTDLMTRTATLMQSGTPATSPEAMALAEEHRTLITEWCYDCTYEIHQGLGTLYAEDPRFTVTIDATAPGLAKYFQAAITANTTRATT